MPLDYPSPALDALLVGIAVQLELSPRDRRVARKRYDLIRDHLHRSNSPLGLYVQRNDALVYPQGSRAIGTTIVHGADDKERFDLDAILEFAPPAGWSEKRVLDELFVSLEGFPDATGVERCTRCVQIQFGFMHLDVTPLAPWPEPRPKRAGDIFHCPDEGEAYPCAANPFGFASWFRDQVGVPSEGFADALKRARESGGPLDRISKGVRADVEQDQLPAETDTRHDAPQVIALKLLKRFLNRRYAERDSKRPPSVFLTKHAALQPPHPLGLTSQLQGLAAALYARANSVRQELAARDEHPVEENPELPIENFLDRWPTTVAEIDEFRGDLRHLVSSLERAAGSDLTEIASIFEELFGERATKASIVDHVRQHKLGQSADERPAYQRGLGFLSTAAAGLVPAQAAPAVSHAPRHHDHHGEVDPKWRDKL